MRVRLSATLAAVALAWAAEARGQAFPPDPLGQSYPASARAEPTSDPEAWWTAPEPLNEVIDPLGRRRALKGSTSIVAPVDASVYRLWGLMPLQSQVLRRDESIYEVWVRPVDASRQAVVRVTLRTDGRAFLQARAGRGCCGPGVGRRVDIDRELDRTAYDRFRALKAHAAWTQPEHVLVQEEGAVAGVCVDGTAYDLMRVEARRTTHLRRSCDPAEIGSVAPLLRPLLGAAQGFDARFDAALKGGTGFEAEGADYAGLLARGGGLSARRGPSAPVLAGEAPPEPLAAGTAGLAEDGTGLEIRSAERAFSARAAQVGAAQAFREFMEENEDRLFPGVPAQPGPTPTAAIAP